MFSPDPHPADLFRVIQDVVQFGYAESGTSSNGTYIHVKRVSDGRAIVDLKEINEARKEGAIRLPAIGGLEAAKNEQSLVLV
jgi:hypothetical protein